MNGLPPYLPRWQGVPCSGDLHTIAAFLNSPDRSLEHYRCERLLIPTSDGTGDTLVADRYEPADSDHDAESRMALVVLLHGLGGHAESVYMRRSAFYLLERGCRVVLVNFRGAGDSRPWCQRHNHPGRTEDLVDLMRWLENEAPPQTMSHGCVIGGYSLGGNILLKFLGKREAVDSIRAAVAISAPLDLAATSERLGDWRNLVYRGYLLKRLRERLLGDDSLSAQAKETISQGKSIRELDARFVAPRAGFESVKAYYQTYSAMEDVQRIDTPTLLLYATDDPFIPSATYLKFPWDDFPQLHPRIVPVGGHTGFRSRDKDAPWHDQCMLHLAQREG